MKAMYLQEPGVITQDTLPKPTIGEDEVLVEIKSVGVCGSDIEYFESGRIGEFIVEKPLILGHEAAGVIAEVGQNVSHLSVGDRVALEPGIPCRECNYCKMGRYNLCPYMDFMATPPSDGAFVEYVAHPADFTFKLEDSFSYDEGALLEPLSVGIHAAKRAKIRSADKVAILGAGPIGLMCVQTSLVGGASEVLVSDLIDFRLDKATELGATETVNVKDKSIDKYNGSFDKVIQTAGTSKTYSQALGLVRRGGRVVQIGHPSSNKVTIDPNFVITNEVDMVGSYRYVNTYPVAISLVKAGKISLEPLISKHFSFNEVAKALKYPIKNPDRCIKAVVHLE